jgi:tetratricopeptide (TPR) repeat protein
MAELLRRRGEAAQAFTHYQTVVRANPRQGLAWLRLAGLYEQAGQQKAAKTAYRKAVRWLPAGSRAGVQARLKLQHTRPALPETMATGWAEFLRQISGPILVCVMFALFDSGLRPWWIPLTGWLAVLLGHFGAFLFVSGASLPRNPVIQWMTGHQGMRSREQKLVVACIGAFLWLVAMGLILWPINQSFPEIPDPW